MSELTSLTIDRGIATISLDHHAGRNSFGQGLLRSLFDNFDAAVADDEVRVIVLTNSGTVFSAGADLKEDRSTLKPGDPSFMEFVHKMDASPKPVIGRIAGHAAGGGAAIVIACDLSVIVDSARIGITEVRLGIPPVPVAALLAHRLTPMAMHEAFLAADMMDASRAAAIGLVNAVVSEAELDATVAHYADALTRGAPAALAETKKTLQAMLGRTMEENLAYAEANHGDVFGQSEAAEGVAAFREKRDANWIPS